MGDIPEPKVAHLFNLFIGWGLAIRKENGLTGWDIIREAL
jgi:hypothetical protein